MTDSKETSWVFKILLLGDSAVGKTTMIKRFIEGEFKEDYKETLGVNIVRKSVNIQELNAKVNLLIWDIAGQERYEKRRKFYYEGCYGALLVYDITRFSSFENIEFKWLRHYKENMQKDNKTLPSQFNQDSMSLWLSVQDVMLVIENVILAAEALGLGSVLLGVVPQIVFPAMKL